MRDITTTNPNISLVTPQPERDAPFAVEWFTSKLGKETLLLMGNAENEISPSTLESERKIMEEFLTLEQEGKQLTWMIRDRDITIGAVWIELVDLPEVKAPAVHIMIGDPAYRGRGVGRAVIGEMMAYLKTELGAEDVYSRHLASNQGAAKLLSQFGFAPDDETYVDVNGLIWQNVHVSLR